MAFINGWGRGTWGELAWGEGSIPVEITGVEATASVNGVGVNGAAVATVGAVTATLGDVTVIAVADANVDVTGQEATSAVGTITNITGKANITPTGQEGTSALGTVTTGAEANVTITDTLVATLGNVSVDIDAEATVIITTGVAATGSAGSLSTITDNRFEIIIPVNMVASDPFYPPTINAKATVAISGVSATGELSNLNIWSRVDDNQTPNWQEVAA